jgi:hypothetical protein
VAVGDVNGDGRLDLAVANRGSFGNVGVLLGNGDGTFQDAQRFSTTATYPQSVAVGDVNADGLPDLAVANGGSFGAAAVSVLLGNGDGTFQDARTFPAGIYPRSVAVADVNGDGRLDLAVANQSSNNVSVLLGNGDGTFQDAQSLPTGGYPTSVAVADVNGDGRLDLAVANGSATVSVLLGNGDGTFQDAVNYAAGGYPWSVAFGDFDGDGWPDLATANYYSNNVSVLLNAADDAGWFALDAPAQAEPGVPFNLTVSARSADGLRLAHGYRGTVAFGSSDAAATLPEPYTFRPEDYGIATFPAGVTLATPGTQDLVAYDLETSTVRGYAALEVGDGPRPGGAPAGAGLLAGLRGPRAGPVARSADRATTAVGTTVWSGDRGTTIGDRATTPERISPATLPPPAARPLPAPSPAAGVPRGLAPQPLLDRLFAAWDGEQNGSETFADERDCLTMA